VTRGARSLLLASVALSRCLLFAVCCSDPGRDDGERVDRNPGLERLRSASVSSHHAA
jgi:hypothetical protein